MSTHQNTCSFYVLYVAQGLHGHLPYSLVFLDICSRPKPAISLVLYQCEFDPTESFSFLSVVGNLNLSEAILKQIITPTAFFIQSFQHRLLQQITLTL